MNNHIYSKSMIANLRKHLEKNTFKYVIYPKFIFLCGKAYSDDYNSTNRGIIEKFMKAKDNNLFFVLSEHLWDNTFNSDIDLLTFEEFLAEVSDAIILFVESAGSFSELGAFSYADRLFNDKLIIVIDNQYRESKSFIMTGPVAKAKNNGAKIIYAPLYDTGLLSSFELRTMVDSLLNELNSKSSSKNKRRINSDSNKIFLNSFILELLEIIKIVQPIYRQDLIELYKKIKNFSSFSFIKADSNKFNKEIKYDYILKLLQTTGLIKIYNDIITTDYYDKISSFMFKYYGKEAAAERNKLICRKYRYKEILPSESN